MAKSKQIALVSSAALVGVAGITASNMSISVNAATHGHHTAKSASKPAPVHRASKAQNSVTHTTHAHKASGNHKIASHKAAHSHSAKKTVNSATNTAQRQNVNADLNNITVNPNADLSDIQLPDNIDQQVQIKVKAPKIKHSGKILMTASKAKHHSAHKAVAHKHASKKVSTHKKASHKKAVSRRAVTTKNRGKRMIAVADARQLSRTTADNSNSQNINLNQQSNSVSDSGAINTIHLGGEVVNDDLQINPDVKLDLANLDVSNLNVGKAAPIHISHSASRGQSKNHVVNLNHDDKAPETNVSTASNHKTSSDYISLGNTVQLGDQSLTLTKDKVSLPAKNVSVKKLASKHKISKHVKVAIPKKSNKHLKTYTPKKHHRSVKTHLSRAEQSAKNWIAFKESSYSYTARNGSCYGRYQLSFGYLHGDLSPRNQERVADKYVRGRYGSWQNAKRFWLQHKWY